MEFTRGHLRLCLQVCVTILKQTQSLRFFTRLDSHFADRVQCVEQLQCVTWPDMEAPKDTCSLLDLIDYTVN